MPGLVGFYYNEPHSENGLSLEEMARRLELDARFQRDLYSDETGGLGRVHLRLINPQPQPVWNDDHTVGLVMEGEFYETAALREEIVRRGIQLRDDGDAEIALRLYEANGVDFASGAEGAFTIAVLDRRQNRLVITNDHLGLYPLYYAQTQEGLIFSSGVRALLANPDLPRDVDPAAIVQLLTFDHMLDDHTILSAVKLMPQASVLCWTDGRLALKKYWFPKYAEIFQLRSEDSYVEELRCLMGDALRRQMGGELKKGVLLSGGVDSRVILGYLSRLMPPQEIETLTFGAPGSDDVRAARETAEAIGTRHHFFELRSDWLLDHADEAVRITDGNANICNLHAYPGAEQEARIAPIIFKGFMGDAMMGYAIRRLFFAEYSDENLAEAHLNTYREQGVLPFDPTIHAEIFAPDFLSAAGDCINGALHDGMLRSGVRHLSGQRLFFDMAQRVPRMTINGVEVVRSHAVVRLPFSDYRLWDFTMKIPPGYLFERYLYNRTFTETFPKLARVPIAHTGLPMVMCMREVQGRNWKFIQMHLRARGLGKLAGPESRPYMDYGAAFRTVLRDWVMDTLLSPSALQSGFFRPETVRKLVAEHMAGAKHTSRLGLLLSVELWRRQFIPSR